jgi:hypothetical protein
MLLNRRPREEAKDVADIKQVRTRADEPGVRDEMDDSIGRKRHNHHPPKFVRHLCGRAFGVFRCRISARAIILPNDRVVIGKPNWNPRNLQNIQRILK